MSDEIMEFKALLACHGADISLWPASVQAVGYKALKRPVLAALIEEERGFEMMLLKRHAPRPSEGFAERIINASLSMPLIPEAAGWMHEVFTQVRPAALAVMLAIGFVIGFNLTTPPAQNQQTAAVPTVSDDEGAIL